MSDAFGIVRMREHTSDPLSSCRTFVKLCSTTVADVNAMEDMRRRMHIIACGVHRHASDKMDAAIDGYVAHARKDFELMYRVQGLDTITGGSGNNVTILSVADSVAFALPSMSDSFEIMTDPGFISNPGGGPGMGQGDCGAVPNGTWSKFKADALHKAAETVATRRAAGDMCRPAGDVVEVVYAPVYRKWYQHAHCSIVPICIVRRHQATGTVECEDWEEDDARCRASLMLSPAFVSPLPYQHDAHELKLGQMAFESCIVGFRQTRVDVVNEMLRALLRQATRLLVLRHRDIIGDAHRTCGGSGSGEGGASWGPMKVHVHPPAPVHDAMIGFEAGKDLAVIVKHERAVLATRDALVMTTEAILARLEAMLSRPEDMPSYRMHEVTLTCADLTGTGSYQNVTRAARVVVATVPSYRT